MAVYTGLPRTVRIKGTAGFQGLLARSPRPTDDFKFNKKPCHKQVMEEETQQLPLLSMYKANSCEQVHALHTYTKKTTREVNKLKNDARQPSLVIITRPAWELYLWTKQDLISKSKKENKTDDAKEKWKSFSYSSPEIQYLGFERKERSKNISPEINLPFTLKSLEYNRAYSWNSATVCLPYNPHGNESNYLSRSRKKYHSKFTSPENGKRP